ncbi:MAG: ion transporter [Stagnimonas sp.]|nr:ion transporter [Stagnimonas sp.]
MSAPPTTKPTIRPLDWLMLVLALVSIGLLCWETWGDVTEAQRQWVFHADYVICALFAMEFLWRWRGAGFTRGFVWRNWYEVLGMIPVAHPAIRGFRLFRVVRILILLARFGMATDRAMGRGFTFTLVNRVSEQVVAAISRPVTLAVLDEVVQVLQQGHYTRNVARALDENRDELRAMALEKIAADPEMRRFKRLPFFDDLIAATVEAALRVVSDLLNDPRTDEFVADVLRENITQLRTAVAQPHAAAPKLS